MASLGCHHPLPLSQLDTVLWWIDMATILLLLRALEYESVKWPINLQILIKTWKGLEQLHNTKLWIKFCLEILSIVVKGPWTNISGHTLQRLTKKVQQMPTKGPIVRPNLQHFLGWQVGTWKIGPRAWYAAFSLWQIGPRKYGVQFG